MGYVFPGISAQLGLADSVKTQGHRVRELGLLNWDLTALLLQISQTMTCPIALRIFNLSPSPKKVSINNCPLLCSSYSPSSSSHSVISGSYCSDSSRLLSFCPFRFPTSTFSSQVAPAACVPQPASGCSYEKPRQAGRPARQSRRRARPMRGRCFLTISISFNVPHPQSATLAKSLAW